MNYSVPLICTLLLTLYFSQLACGSDTDFWKGVNGSQLIQDLDEDNHDQFIQGQLYAFVMYYTNQSKNSRQARPGFAGAADHYKSNAKLKFGSSDCEQDGQVCKLKNHRDFKPPAFYLYKNGEFYDQFRGNPKFSGQYSKREFIKFLNKKISN